jgi:hypothetical protein
MKKSNRKVPARAIAAPPDRVSLSAYVTADAKQQIAEWGELFANPFNPKPKPGHVIDALVDFAKAHGFADAIRNANKSAAR